MAHNSHRRLSFCFLLQVSLYVAIGSATESEADSESEEEKYLSDPEDTESDKKQQKPNKRHRFAIERYETPSPKDKNSLLLSSSLVSESSSEQEKKKAPRRKKSTSKGRKSNTTEVADPPEKSPVSENLHLSKENRRLARNSSSRSTSKTAKMPAKTRRSSTAATAPAPDDAAEVEETTTTGPTTVTMSELKEKYKAAKAEVKKLTNDNTELEEEIGELREEIDDIRDQYDKVMDELNQARKKGYDKRNQGYADLVVKKTKRELWRTVKFLSNKNTELLATEMVLDLMKIKEFMLTNDKAKDKVIKAKRADFIGTYRGDTREGINEQRSYVQSQMKKVFNKTMDNDEVPPSIDDLYKVITRDIPLPDDDDDDAVVKEHERLMEVMLWYTDVLLPKCAGNIYWRDTIRRHQTISTATHEGKNCITSSTEAMCALMYDNCREKWEKMYKMKKEDPTAKMPKKKDDPETDELSGKYSDAQSGQSKYGGWNPEGLAKFQETVAKVKAARKTEKSAKLEQICLEMIRHKYKIKPEDHAGATAGKRGKKRKKAPVPAALVIDFDDE